MYIGGVYMKFDGCNISFLYESKWNVGIKMCLSGSEKLYAIFVGKRSGFHNICSMIFTITGNDIDKNQVHVGYFNYHTGQKILGYDEAIDSMPHGKEFYQVACNIALPVLAKKVTIERNQIELMDWDTLKTFPLSGVLDNSALRQELVDFRSMIGKVDMIYYGLYDGISTLV